MKDTTILFDLDGTLTDSAEGIFNGIIYALKRFDMEIEDRERLYKCIGPPLKYSFMNFFELQEADADRAVSFYREYYQDKGIFQNRLYDGIEELLKLLRDKEFTMAVATSKPEPYARRIIEKFQIDKYFSFVGGSGLDGSRGTKTEVMQYVLDELGVKNPGKVFMVGDRNHDIIGAKTIGTSSIGVLYGYGSMDELKNAKADYIVHTVEEVGELLTRKLFDNK